MGEKDEGRYLKSEGEEEKWSKKRIEKERLNVSARRRHHRRGLVETIPMVCLAYKIDKQTTERQGKREKGKEAGSANQ